MMTSISDLMTSLENSPAEAFPHGLSKISTESISTACSDRLSRSWKIQSTVHAAERVQNPALNPDSGIQGLNTLLFHGIDF
jgi:hypothetical protein